MPPILRDWLSGFRTSTRAPGAALEYVHGTFGLELSGDEPPMHRAYVPGPAEPLTT